MAETGCCRSSKTYFEMGWRQNTNVREFASKRAVLLRKIYKTVLGERGPISRR